MDVAGGRIQTPWIKKQKMIKFLVMKNIEQLTIKEQRGLAIAILREELGYKWLLISHIMNLSEGYCQRAYKQFQNIYKTNN